MTASTVTAQEHLESIIVEVGEYYDRDDKQGALACLLSRAKDHPGTVQIADRVILVVMAFGLGWGEGKEYIQAFIRGMLN